MQAVPDLSDKKGKGKPKKGKSHLHQALQCALDITKRKVIMCPNDSVGIIFFNTVRLRPSVAQVLLPPTEGSLTTRRMHQ